MVYNPPDDYQYDPGSGLYYTQIIAKDSNGNASQVVTWFDTQTGRYRQCVYPVGEGSGRKDTGSDSPNRKRMIVVGISVATALVAAFVVTAVIMSSRRQNSEMAKSSIEIADNTVDAGGQDVPVSDMTDQSIEDSDSWEAENDGSYEEPEEEMVMTDSAETEQYPDGAPDLANCFGVDEDEVLKANITIMDIAQGNKYSNGEMVEWFSFDEAGERGITRLFFHTEPLSGDGDVSEYYIDVQPLGSRFSTLHGQDCIETRVSGGGLDITFYVLIDGSEEIDAQSTETDAGEHQRYPGFGFGRGIPADYYMM